MKDWITTILGLIAAVWVAIEPIINSGNVDYNKLGLAALIAAYGYFTKDKSKGNE